MIRLIVTEISNSKDSTDSIAKPPTAQRTIWLRMLPASTSVSRPTDGAPQSSTETQRCWPAPLLGLTSLNARRFLTERTELNERAVMTQWPESEMRAIALFCLCLSAVRFLMDQASTACIGVGMVNGHHVKEARFVYMARFSEIKSFQTKKSKIQMDSYCSITMKLQKKN